MANSRICIALLALVTIVWSASGLRAADTLPNQLADDTYWKLIETSSESGGSFQATFIRRLPLTHMIGPQLAHVLLEHGGGIAMPRCILRLLGLSERGRWGQQHRDETNE